MNPAVSNPQPAELVSTASAVPGRRMRPLRSLRVHAKAAIATFLLVVILGGVFVWKRGVAKYYAQAVVYISPRFLKNLDDDKEFDLQSNTQYREFVQQNVRTVNRYDIVEEAVRRLDTGPHAYRHPGETLASAVNRLQGELRVLPVPDTYQITIGLEGAKAAGLAEVANTVAAVFLEKSKEEDFYGRDQRLASLRDEAARLSTEIAARSTEKDHLAQQLGVSTFSESFANPFDRLLVDSKEALAAGRQKRIVAAAQLAALERTTASGDSALHAYALEMTQKDADMTTLEANLNLRRSELMARLNGMLPNHPGRTEIGNELGEIDDLLRSKRETLTRRYSSMLLSQRQAEASADRQAESLLQAEVDMQAKQAAWYSSNYQKGLNLAYEMERARKRLESIGDRIGFISLESQAPGFARIFSPARQPSMPMGGGRSKLSLMVLCAAVALAVVVPLGIDMLDPHILTADETQRLIGFAPIGFTYDSQRVSLAKATDRLRRLAAALERDAQRNASRSFLFVPVNENAALQSLLTQVAEVLRGLGHPVCVLSAAGLPSPAMASAAAAGSRESVRACPGPEGIGRKFDALRTAVASVAGGMILAMTGPLAGDAEAELLASACDVVVLTVQSRITTKAELRAAARTLERIQPRGVSVLVTGYDPGPPVPAFAGGLRPWLAAFRQTNVAARKAGPA